MKTKLILISLVFLFSGMNCHAQLMEKLKERAKEKGLETREVSLDTSDNAITRTTSYEEEELVINSAKDFFTTDVVMALYNAKGELVQTSFFDAESIAMRTETVVDRKPIYHDRTGKFYAFDDEIGQYKSMSLLPGSSMGFMTAGMTTQVYKLPQTPYFEAFDALSKLDIAMNFLILEMAFIYKPKHFEKNAFYKPSQISCGGNTCTRFSYNDVEYEGSYIQFDSRGRLRELNIISTKSQSADDNRNPSGKFIFSYKPCNVKLPDAVEQSIIPGPMGKIFNLEKGLEPWKHNKKDKEKQKDN